MTARRDTFALPPGPVREGLLAGRHDGPIPMGDGRFRDMTRRGRCAA